MTLSVSPKQVHNAWYKDYLCIFGFLYYLLIVWERIATVSKHCFKFVYPVYVLKEVTTREENLLQTATIESAFSLCTWIFYFCLKAFILHTSHNIWHYVEAESLKEGVIFSSIYLYKKSVGT